MTWDRNDELESLYDAFNGRDIEGFLNHLHPDVEWADGPDGGHVRGRQEVGAFVEGEWQAGDPRVEPMRIEVAPGGDRATVLVHRLVTSPAGRIVEDSRYLHVYAFDGAFVKRLDILAAPEDDEDEEDEDA